MSFQGEIDRAVLELAQGRGGFRLTDLREQLKVPSVGPQAKQLANRLYALAKKHGILRTEGKFKRNRLYLLNKGKDTEAFERRVNSSLRSAPNGRLHQIPEGAPIKRLARLAELDDLAATLRDLAVKVTRIDTRVAELHAGLFGEPTRGGGETSGRPTS